MPSKITYIGHLFRFFLGIGSSVGIHMHVFAVNIVNNVPDYTGLPGEDGGIVGWEKTGGVTTVLSRAIERGLDITAMLAVIAICIAGYLYVTARGDPEKAKKATKYLGVILLGLLIALTAYVIIALIDKIPHAILSL